MAEEKNAENNAENTAELYAEALENVKTLKTAASEAKATLRKFKKANKVRKAEDIKDEKIKGEFDALELASTTATTALDEAKTAASELKPTKQRGGGGSYSYGQIADAETGEMRDLTPQEKKKWRTKARKLGKKEEIEASQVPFDPTLFAAKPAKKDKKDKEEDAPKEDAPADAPKEDAPKDEKKKRRSRKDK